MGLAVFSCMPTTLSSGVALVLAVRFHSACVLEFACLADVLPAHAAAATPALQLLLLHIPCCRVAL